MAEREADLDVAPVAVVARLARLRGHLETELERTFRAHGLSAATFAVLVTLARLGDERVSQRRLMDELGLTSGTISVRMDRLIAEASSSGARTRTPGAIRSSRSRREAASCSSASSRPTSPTNVAS